MEKLVPLLIALAIFGFKSYQNYMKEQEAALKEEKVLPLILRKRNSSLLRINLFRKKHQQFLQHHFILKKLKKQMKSNDLRKKEKSIVWQ